MISKYFQGQFVGKYSFAANSLSAVYDGKHRNRVLGLRKNYAENSDLSQGHSGDIPVTKGG